MVLKVQSDQGCSIAINCLCAVNFVHAPYLHLTRPFVKEKTKRDQSSINPPPPPALMLYKKALLLESSKACLPLKHYCCQNFSSGLSNLPPRITPPTNLPQTTQTPANCIAATKL